MPVTAVVGAQWGDEGKGRVIDYLAEEADMVIRFQGGDNAGHTVVNDLGLFRLHLVPSGIFYPATRNIVGAGTVVNPASLLSEMQALAEAGVDLANLWLSDRAHMVMPYHVLLDRAEEERLGDRAFGSTRSGIAPFYADKVMKVGVQVADLFDERRLGERVERSLEAKNVLLEHLYG